MVNDLIINLELNDSDSFQNRINKRIQALSIALEKWNPEGQLIDFKKDAKMFIARRLEQSCPFCDQQVFLANFLDQESKDEFEMTGLCMECQDAVFVDGSKFKDYDHENYIVICHANKQVTFTKT